MILVNDQGNALSARFAAAMAQGHTIVSRFEIWQPGASTALYVSPTTLADADYMSGVIIDGSITLTKNSDQRGQCNVVIASPDSSLIPTVTTAPLTPWGNEIRIFSGVQYADGTTEYVSMGYYRINEVQATEQQGAVQITVNGYDRSRNVSRNVVQVYWPDAQTQANLFGETSSFIGNQVSWPAMIQYVLSAFWPYMTYNDTAANWFLAVNDQQNCVVPAGSPPNFSEGTDMFDQMRQFAQAAGCDLFIDRATGRCTFYADPVMSFFNATPPSPVVSWVEGAGCQFDQLQRNLNDQTAYNRVIVYGSGDIVGQISPLSSLVQYFGGAVSPGVLADDDDPNSPTWIGVVDTNPGSLTYGQVIGPSGYGVVSNVVTSNLLVSQAQVNSFAQLTLRQNIGSQEQLVINSGLTDPRVDVDDCVQVTREKDGVNTLYLVESLTIPLTMKEAMQMTLREHRNLS